jgi:hypothetical protein
MIVRFIPICITIAILGFYPAVAQQTAQSQVEWQNKT